MKPFYAILLLLLTSLPVSADNHLVLIEEFTNVGCLPCALWSPILDETVHDRFGQCIAIKYHSWWPEANDSFYNYDPQPQRTRILYYGVDGVPATFVNGVQIGDQSIEMLNTAIDYFLEQPQSYGLSVSKTLQDHHLTVHVDFTPYINNDEASQVRLFVGVLEEHITSSRPYSNGETEQNYTLRKLLTGGDGYQPGDGTLQADQTYTYDSAWDIDFMDDENQLSVLAFVQDLSTREILCSAYACPASEKENHLSMVKLANTPDLICTDNYYGQVVFYNDGANALTSANLNVEVNGTVKQYPWSGQLQHLERDTLTFDDMHDFPLADAENHVKVWFSDINGTASESGVLTSTFSNSIQAMHDVQLRLYTDKKPEETTWKLYNSAGDVVRQGGPYAEGRKLYTENFELKHDDCYLLEFEDAGGDGIKGANGNGYYQLYQLNEAGTTNRLTQGDFTGRVHDVYFHLTGTPGHDKRLVLFEEFTNTSCDPCSEFSPSLDKTIYARMGEMVPITYHLNFPSNNDPFYQANPGDAMARGNYYDVSGVPSLRVDGEHAGAWGFEEYLDSYIDVASEVPAAVDLDTRAEMTDGELTVNVNLTPVGINDGRNLRLHVAVVEEDVEWEAPAPNGERKWNYVMRKLLPDSQGEPLPSTLTDASRYRFTYSWPVDHFYDENELGIVTFVQDDNTKQVLGTCYTPCPTGSPRAAKILDVLHQPNRICLPQYSADLSVRNTGRETLYNAVINVSINGTLQRTPWTGRMDYLAIDTLHIPLFDTFSLNTEGTNEVEIWLSDLNGGTEESVHKTMHIDNSYKAQHAVRLTLMTDNAPEEITWKVYDSTGETVCTGGPYSEARKKQVVDLPLTEDDCYLLVFEDAGGNGITGDNGRGYYMLHEVKEDGSTRLLVQTDYTGATHEVYFRLTDADTAGIAPVTDKASEGGHWYDLGGRRVTHPHKGVYIHDKKKLSTK